MAPGNSNFKQNRRSKHKIALIVEKYVEQINEKTKTQAKNVIYET